MQDRDEHEAGCSGDEGRVDHAAQWRAGSSADEPGTHKGKQHEQPECDERGGARHRDGGDADSRGADCRDGADSSEIAVVRVGEQTVGERSKGSRNDNRDAGEVQWPVCAAIHGFPTGDLQNAHEEPDGWQQRDRGGRDKTGLPLCAVATPRSQMADIPKDRSQCHERYRLPEVTRIWKAGQRAAVARNEFGCDHAHRAAPEQCRENRCGDAQPMNACERDMEAKQSQVPKHGTDADEARDDSDDRFLQRMRVGGEHGHPSCAPCRGNETIAEGLDNEDQA